MVPHRGTVELTEDGRAPSDGGWAATRVEAAAGNREIFDGPIFRKATLAVTATVILAFPLCAVALAAFVDSEEAAAWLQMRVARATGRDVTIGRLGVAVFPHPGIRVDDVRIGSGGVETPSLASLSRVHLDISLSRLLVGDVSVRRARIDGAVIRLEVTEDGTSNFGDFVPSSALGAPTSATSPPISFAVREVVIEDASLTYFDGASDRSYAFMGGQASVAVSVDPDGGWAASVHGASDSLLVRVPDWFDEIVRTEGARLSASARGDAGLDRVEIEEGSLEVWGERVSVDGLIEGLRELDPRIELRFANPAFDAGALTAALPRSIRARRVPLLAGVLDISLTLSGALTAEKSPTWTGSVGVSGMELRLGGEGFAANVGGEVEVTSDSLRVDRFSGTLGGGAFELSGAMDRASGSFAFLFDASPTLDDFDDLELTPFGVSLAGDVEADVAVAGLVSHLDSVTVTGIVRATGLRAEHDRLGLPIYVPSAELELSDEGVAWSDLEVLVGTEVLATSGRIRGPVASWVGGGTPLVDAVVSGRSLELGALLPPERGALVPPERTRTVGGAVNTGRDTTWYARGFERPSYTRVAFAHLGGRRIDGVSAGRLVSESGFSRPVDLPLRGSLELDVERFSYGAYRLDSLTARIVVSDSTLAIEGADFMAWGGGVAGWLRMGIGDRVDEPFALHVVADSLEGERFLSMMTPLGGMVSGRVHLDVEMEGTLDGDLMPLLESLEARGRVRLTGGRVAGTGINHALADFLAVDDWTDLPFDVWEADVAVRSGMVLLERSWLDGDLARVGLVGAIGFGGAVDLAMALSVPPGRLQAVSLRRTGVAQTVLDRLTAANSSLDLGIRITGSIDGPTLEPDALAATEQDGTER